MWITRGCPRVVHSGASPNPLLQHDLAAQVVFTMRRTAEILSAKDKRLKDSEHLGTH